MRKIVSAVSEALPIRRRSCHRQPSGRNNLYRRCQSAEFWPEALMKTLSKSAARTGAGVMTLPKRFLAPTKKLHSTM